MVCESCKEEFEQMIRKSILQLRWEKGHGTRKGNWINDGLGQLGQLLSDKLGKVK